VNHLAHLLLSGPDPDLRAGGFLGDFVRGRLRGEHAPGIELGIRLHRFIDATTDRHPLTRAAAALFPPDHRRWAPVALDVWFDHLLARDFQALTGRGLDGFARQAYDDLEARDAHLNPAARGFLARMRETHLLQRYTERTTITRVLEALGRRSHRAAALPALDQDLDRLAPELDAAFAALLPAITQATHAWLQDAGQVNAAPNPTSG